MPRIVWKGAISFGLVHVPVVVYPGARAGRLDFDWLDKRDMAPVGYRRINKNTGKPIENEFIVKGYQYEKGEYVLMSDEDFRRANEAATQTVEILGFVEAAQVPIYYFDTPYYLEPDRRGEKGYRLLREVLRKTGRIGIANVVLHTKQHLAALMPEGDALVLMTMRYADDIISMKDLKLPEGKSGKDGPSPREIEMAQRLVDDMTQEWDPAQYHDTYREDLLARIEEKIQSGQTHELTEAEETAAPRESAKVIDLMALLKKSIDQRGKRPAGKSAGDAKNQDRDDAADDDADEAGSRGGKGAGRAKAAAKTRASGGRTGNATAKKAATSGRKTAAKTTAKTATKTAAKKASVSGGKGGSGASATKQAANKTAKSAAKTSKARGAGAAHRSTTDATRRRAA